MSIEFKLWREIKRVLVQHNSVNFLVNEIKRMAKMIMMLSECGGGWLQCEWRVTLLWHVRRLNTKYTSDYDLRIYMMVDKNDIVGNTENIELSISENKKLVCIDQTHFPSCQKRMVCKRKRNNYFFSHLISFPGSTHTIAFLQFSFLSHFCWHACLLPV